MTTDTQRILTELQNVLTRNHAALFFGPNHEGELYVDGFCVGHITHSDNCELVEGSICETSNQHHEREGGVEG